jgi:hypothetical protein
MKTMSKILMLALAAGVTLSSCKKEKDEPSPYDEPGFSTLSPSENKAEIEKAGIDLMNQMDGLTDAEAMDAATQLGELSNGTSTKKAVEGVGVVSVLSSVDDNAISLKAFLEEAPITEEMNDIEGIYTWNPSIEDFDVTEANNIVTFLFPFDENSSTNDCELTLEVTPVTLSGELITDLTESISKASMTLTVKGTEVSSLTFTADYNSQGVPSNVVTTLKVDTYKWEYSASQSSSKVASDFLFANGSTTIMNYGVEVGGNLNLDDIEAYSEKIGEMAEYEEGIVTEGGTFIQDVKCYYQIMNVKLVETANTKEIAAAVDDLAKKYNGFEEMTAAQEEAAQEEVLEIANSKINIFLMYADNNQKIADVQFYITEVTSTDTWEEYNYMTGETETVSETTTSEELMPQFVFGDESLVDADAYFQEGFEDFEAEMETMVDELDEMMSSFEGSSDEPSEVQTVNSGM